VQKKSPASETVVQLSVQRKHTPIYILDTNTRSKVYFKKRKQKTNTPAEIGVANIISTMRKQTIEALVSMIHARNDNSAF
jgi:hypothetical protein